MFQTKFVQISDLNITYKTIIIIVFLDLPILSLLWLPSVQTSVHLNGTVHRQFDKVMSR
jgi:hypothetical protein